MYVMSVKSCFFLFFFCFFNTLWYRLLHLWWRYGEVRSRGQGIGGTIRLLKFAVNVQWAVKRIVRITPYFVVVVLIVAKMCCEMQRPDAGHKFWIKFLMSNFGCNVVKMVSSLNCDAKLQKIFDIRKYFVIFFKKMQKKLYFLIFLDIYI